MTIPITLNGEKIVLDANPYEKLVNVLRRYGVLSAKCGCCKGTCASCTVLLNNKVVPSCIVPVALSRNASIITLEYFSKTEEFSDIAKGFHKAGIKLCGYCNAGKIFSAWNILNTNTKPNRHLIYEQVSFLSPCCINTDLLIDGILYSFDFKSQRLGGPKNAK